jgi:hypothetical protein
MFDQSGPSGAIAGGHCSIWSVGRYSYTPIQSRQLVCDGAGFSTAYLNLNELVLYRSSTSVQSGPLVDVGASYSYTPI